LLKSSGEEVGLNKLMFLPTPFKTLVNISFSFLKPCWNTHHDHIKG